jgi:hypothetical protein
VLERAIIGASEEQVFLYYLLELEFACVEALQLINVREHLYESSAMRQPMADDCRMQFARWLYEQGEIREA